MNGNECKNHVGVGALLLMILVVFSVSVDIGWSQTGGTFTSIIPQVVVGSFDGGLTRYSTVIEIVNSTPISTILSGNFFKQDGTFANLVLTTNLTALPFITNGVFSNAILDSNKVFVITAEAPAS